MKICPKCHCHEQTKDGIVGDRQRYKCKVCHYRFTVEQRGFCRDTKRYAVILYLQGFNFRMIGRILHCSHVTVRNWMKPYGQSIKEIRSQADTKIVTSSMLQGKLAQHKKETGSILLIDMGNNQEVTLYCTSIDTALIQDEKVEK